MVDSLLFREWEDPNPLGNYLREVLPDEYVVVTDLAVHGRSLDAVVVGPRGLLVVHPKDWGGEIYPSLRGPWRERLGAGQEVQHPNPAEEVLRATKALQAFLRDEFPSVQPAIRHLLLLTNPEARLMSSEATSPLVVHQNTMAEAVTAAELWPDDSELDAEMRESLALALRERRLTASQRASESFVFRSGGFFGSGKKVWTVRAAVRHIDRHPEDGIFHLQNGTLARWLSEQGAEHLAGLAREVMRQRGTDPRVPLETFLIGTGLVRRPRLSVRPRRFSLGCTLSGESCGCRVQVRKGRGRGYLFGTLHTSDPWLRVEPRSFSGNPLEAMVTADTETLPISRTPWQAEILVESSASEEPVSLPVRVRVVGMPSSLNRYLFRPLVGALTAGLLGAAIGWALGHWSMEAPGGLEEMGAISISSAAAWAVLIGLFWAALGAIRGLLQPVAWPITYATGRWLVRTLVWGVALSLLAAVGHWAWRYFDPGLGAGSLEAASGTTILLGLALAIVPATLGEIGSYSRAERGALRGERRSALRPLLLAAVGVLLVLLLVVGGVLVGPAWQQLDLEGTASSAGEWAGERWTQLETGVSDLYDQLYLRYYDRRAPAGATPALTPGPAPAPTAGVETP